MQRVLTKDAAEVLAWPGLSNHQARGRIHRWAVAGILPHLGKSGVGAKASWQFDRETVVIAAVLFALFDLVGVHDAARLRAAYTLLADHAEGDDGPTLITAILNDIESGALPVLAATVWSHPSGSVCTSFAVRLGAEFKRLLIAPAENTEPIWHGVLELAPLLRRFIDNQDNVTPLHKAGA